MEEGITGSMGAYTIPFEEAQKLEELETGDGDFFKKMDELVGITGEEDEQED